MSHHHPLSPTFTVTAEGIAPVDPPKQPRGMGSPIIHIDDAGFFPHDNPEGQLQSNPEGVPLSEEVILDTMKDITNLKAKSDEVEEALAALPKNPYPFPQFHHVGSDPKTGKRGIRSTIPPGPVNYKADLKPMSMDELSAAAERVKVNFSCWIFARNIRGMLLRMGYQLGLAA